jgi:hypothetical protein
VPIVCRDVVTYLIEWSPKILQIFRRPRQAQTQDQAQAKANSPEISRFILRPVCDDMRFNRRP